jgi:hypothetical protein
MLRSIKDAAIVIVPIMMGIGTVETMMDQGYLPSTLFLFGAVVAVPTALVLMFFLGD